jgi:DNA polymerase
MLEQKIVGPADSAPANLEEVRQEAEQCRRCSLWRDATQTVFGEGMQTAKLMLVGEQAGDREDLKGTPFVGPAGEILDRALADAGIDRQDVYLTNAVKHFKFQRYGKRRIHQRPNAGEISACRWWLEQERAVIRPQVIVALGVTAAQALTGHALRISESRGNPQILDDGSELHVTIHPSFLLRMARTDKEELEYARFVVDLKAAAQSADDGQRRASVG